LKLSTYFSGMKLRWMIDNHSEVRKAHDKDDLLFGTLESWVVYVGLLLPQNANRM
jgi:glycerol kinase